MLMRFLSVLRLSLAGAILNMGFVPWTYPLVHSATLGPGPDGPQTRKKTSTIHSNILHFVGSESFVVQKNEGAGQGEGAEASDVLS